MLHSAKMDCNITWHFSCSSQWVVIGFISKGDKLIYTTARFNFLFPDALFSTSITFWYLHTDEEVQAFFYRNTLTHQYTKFVVKFNIKCGIMTVVQQMCIWATDHRDFRKLRFNRMLGFVSKQNYRLLFVLRLFSYWCSGSSGKNIILWKRTCQA